MIKSFNSDDNITSPQKIDEDRINENNLRPSCFKDFIGQTDLINNLRNKGILLSLDGPNHNVIKIKPPLPFNKSDVDFALKQFEDLWKDGVDISEKFVDTIRTKTWLNEDISPYQLYLKMLYEYLKEDINLDQEITVDMPDGFMDLQYQQQAIVSAKKILEAFHGVFIADVVGLGKTKTALRRP